VRIGTWNIDRERGPEQNMATRAAIIQQLRLDVLVITEPGPAWSCRDDVVISPAERLDRPLPESWVTIRAAGATRALPLPYGRLATAALTNVGGRSVVIYGAVLPWGGAVRATGLAHAGESFASMFSRVLDEQVADLEYLTTIYPDALRLWAGDFNQTLEGPNLGVGSTRGRQQLEEALTRLGFAAWNRHQPHGLPGLATIDLICGPANMTVTSSERIDPNVDGRRLSDHAAYVVEVD
jgi:endonuclease/exonuclease/phosphatase family metal-dependent hydrolase